jgi:hypothetical protein
MNISHLLQELNPEIIGNDVYIDLNIFTPVSEDEIKEAEELLGFPFPDELRNFYKNIGYGSLAIPPNAPKDYVCSVSNEILPPFIVANFAKGILRWEGQHSWMAEPTYEFMEPGDLPFFEIGDSSSFLVMKPHSDNPNAVWTDGIPVKIEDSFERFIHRLYYESPSFYGDIIEAYIAKLKQKNKPQ